MSEAMPEAVAVYFTGRRCLARFLLKRLAIGSMASVERR